MLQYSVSDRLCILQLDCPPLNTITRALLEDLRAAVRRANAQGDIGGIIITGDAHHFSAGADIGLFREVASAAEAIRTSQLFQRAFQEVEDSAKPVAAAMAGRVMGGALELALACHFRVCAKGTTFNMPEVNLGINPGAGGTQRLPRLVGLATALRMLLTAEAVEAAQALALGLVDAVCDGELLLATARSVLQSHSLPCKTSLRTDRIQDAQANAAAFCQAEKSVAGIRPELIAPRKIIEAVRAGIEESIPSGLRKEQEAVAQCLATLATQNKIYLFFATREASKIPSLSEVPAADIARTAVIGMGTMGTGIAEALVMAGVPVAVCDENDLAVRKAIERIRASLQKRVAQGRLLPERADAMLSLLAPASGRPDIAAADLVIESVFEDVAAKRSVLGHLEDVCRCGTIIASNTSTISLDVLADGMKHPERLIGMHFFNPAHRMPLVEIIRRESTSPSVIAAAVQFAKRIRKTPVLVRNREGFLVTRLFVPYVKEAFFLLEEGAEPAAIDRALVEFGFPMGPLALADMAGLDILAASDRMLCRAFPRHGPVAAVAARLVERGCLGQKAGTGVYKYEPGDYTPYHSELTDQIVAEVQREAGRAAGCVPSDEIAERLVLRMANEAFFVLQEGIAQRESDLDVALVLGTGFPEFRGGVLKYARDLGLHQVCARLENLAGRLGERFAPCQLL